MAAKAAARERRKLPVEGSTFQELIIGETDSRRFVAAR
jgi:hypothetical protein